MINATATVLGCMALVVMIATVVRVVMVKLWESAKVNPDYVQSVYEDDLEHNWSGRVKEQPALLAGGGEPSAAASKPAMASPTIPEVELPPAASKGGSTTGASAASSPTPAAQSSTPEASGIQNIESKRDRIENTVRGFFEAATMEPKLAFVRDPGRVAPLMANYYNHHPIERHEWKGLGWILPVEEPGFRLGYAQAIFANAEPVSLIIEELGDGSFRVDWESSVRYSEVDWNEFIKTRPDSPKLFRVIASKPRNPPSDEAPQDSEVLELKHPDDDDVIYAYFDRKDPKFQPLIQQLQTGNWKDVPLTLRLCYPGPSGGGKTARIADVEGKGWLILHGTRS